MIDNDSYAKRIARRRAKINKRQTVSIPKIIKPVEMDKPVSDDKLFNDSLSYMNYCKYEEDIDVPRRSINLSWIPKLFPVLIIAAFAFFILPATFDAINEVAVNDTLSGDFTFFEGFDFSFLTWFVLIPIIVFIFVGAFKRSGYY